MMADDSKPALADDSKPALANDSKPALAKKPEIKELKKTSIEEVKKDTVTGTKTAQSPSGIANVYEPLCSDSLDRNRNVYTKCKQNSLSRAQPVSEMWETQSAKKRSKINFDALQIKLPNPKWIVAATATTILIIVVLSTLAIATAALATRQRRNCSKEMESEILTSKDTITTKELPLEKQDYTTVLVICTYDDGKSISTSAVSTATLRYSSDEQSVSCLCTLPSINSTLITPPSCTLRITRCRI